MLWSTFLQVTDNPKFQNGKIFMLFMIHYNFYVACAVDRNATNYGLRKVKNQSNTQKFIDKIENGIFYRD